MVKEEEAEEEVGGEEGGAYREEGRGEGRGGVGTGEQQTQLGHVKTNADKARCQGQLPHHMQSTCGACGQHVVDMLFYMQKYLQNVSIATMLVTMETESG